MHYQQSRSVRRVVFPARIEGKMAFTSASNCPVATSLVGAKQQAVSLLRLYQVSVDQVQEISNLEDEGGVLSYVLALIKPKLEELSQARATLSIQLEHSKLQNLQSAQKIEELFQQHTHHRVRELSLRASEDVAKRQWQDANERLLQTKRQVQDIDNQLFKKSKECSSAQQEIKSIKHFNVLVTAQLKLVYVNLRTLEGELKATRDKFRTQQLEIFKILEIKQEQVEQLTIKNTLGQKEYEVIEREYFRWKQRCLSRLDSASPNVAGTHNAELIRQSEHYLLMEELSRLRTTVSQLKSQRQEAVDELEEIKEVLRCYGIDYDKFEDAALIKQIRKQKKDGRSPSDPNRDARLGTVQRQRY